MSSSGTCDAITQRVTEALRSLFSQNPLAALTQMTPLSTSAFPMHLQESCCKSHYPFIPLCTENLTLAFTSLASVTVSELPLQVRRCLQLAFCFPRSFSLKVQINELMFLQISVIGRWFHKLGLHPTPHLMEGVVQLHICNHPDTHITPGLAKV